MADRPRVSLLRAARLVLRFAWRADRGRAVLTGTLYALEAVLGSLFALWLKLLVDGVAARQTVPLVAGAGLVAVSVSASMGLDFAASRVRMILSERVHHLVERELMDAIGSTPTLEIHETPEHLTQLELLDAESWEFGQVTPALVDLLAIAIRVVVATLLLLSVSPLLLLLPLFGLPALVLSPVTGDLFAKGGELAAEPARRGANLFELAAGAEAAKEIRVFRLGNAVLDRFHQAHRQVRGIYLRLGLRNGALGLCGQLVFVAGYVGAIALAVERARSGLSPVGDVILTAVLAGQVLGLVTGSATMLQWAGRTLRATSRYFYLTRVATDARARVDTTVSAPSRLRQGIRLESVSYRYPGAGDDSLHSIDLDLPAGATVAIVGENGAGKSTLVKLLAALYAPGSGRITVDGVDLSRLDPERWRERVSAGFQDYVRFEFSLGEAVGLGWLPHLEDEAALRAALARAGAADLLADLPHGLATQLGPSWPGGVDLSGGQWQKVALGRAMVRPRPLLLLLDEPTAALDAETEHRLFEQWTITSRQLRVETGAVTVLVSHRFSTVRMADMIVVLEQGRIVEQGDHSSLMARAGTYAELYALQAAAYR